MSTTSPGLPVSGDFDLLVDYGTFDDRSTNDRAAYVDQVAALTKPGAKFPLWCFEGDLKVGSGWQAPILPFGNIALRPGEVERWFARHLRDQTGRRRGGLPNGGHEAGRHTSSPAPYLTSDSRTAQSVDLSWRQTMGSHGRRLIVDEVSRRSPRLGTKGMMAQAKARQSQDPYAQQGQDIGLVGAAAPRLGRVGPLEGPGAGRRPGSAHEHRLWVMHRRGRGDAQESVRRAGELLTAKGPIGPYTDQ